jgi:hypothetical protein
VGRARHLAPALSCVHRLWKAERCAGGGRTFIHFGWVAPRTHLWTIVWLERLEIRHHIQDLTRSELKSWHCGMDPLEQGPLQVGNRISDTHFAEWGSVLEPARADLADSVTLRAMHANEYHAAAYRRRRRLRDSGFNGAQQNCSQDEKWHWEHLHSITSSARASSVGDKVRPRTIPSSCEPV